MKKNITDKEMREKIKDIGKGWNMSEKDVKELLERVSKPSLDNTHCDFDKNPKIGVGPSDQPIKNR